MKPDLETQPEPETSSRIGRFRTKMFDQGGLEEIFRHVRNIVTSSFILAAGLYAVKYPRSINIRGVIDISMAGYGVACLGGLLFLFSLLDGMHQLSKFRWHFVFQILLVVIYLMITIRVEQIVLSFRAS